MSGNGDSFACNSRLIEQLYNLITMVLFIMIRAKTKTDTNKNSFQLEKVIVF